MQSRGVLSRRALLGLAGLTVVACGKHPQQPPPNSAPKPPGVPDAAALASARTSEAALLDSYDAKIHASALHKRAPLQVSRAIHATHLAALHGTPNPVATAGPATPHLHAAIRASAVQLRRFANAAIDGANAALLASIAASHETSVS